MPFTPDFRDACKAFSLEAIRTGEVETNDRILQRIIEGI